MAKKTSINQVNNLDLVSISAKLIEDFEGLTSNDLKHCIQIIKGQSVREAALNMNLTIKGVEGARTRLRKKMNVSKDIYIPEFLNNWLKES